MTIALSASPTQFEELTSSISGVDWVVITNDSIPEKQMSFLPGCHSLHSHKWFWCAGFPSCRDQNVGGFEHARRSGSDQWLAGIPEKKQWEVAGKWNEKLTEIASALGKQLVPVPDQPGFVTARVLSMIINEAWLALEEGVSTKAEIDIAMKLGTNYPLGHLNGAHKLANRRFMSCCCDCLKPTKLIFPPLPYNNTSEHEFDTTNRYGHRWRNCKPCAKWCCVAAEK